MINPMNYLLTDRYRLVVSEVDVTRVLRVINAHHKSAPDMRVGSCGRPDDNSKWFIHFTTTKAKWDAIVEQLKIKRVWKDEEIPNNINGVVYSTN